MNNGKIEILYNDGTVLLYYDGVVHEFRMYDWKMKQELMEMIENTITGDQED